MSPRADLPGEEPPSRKLRSADSEVEFIGVSRRFGETVAIEDVDLRAPKGGITVLIGPSGCGKSTLLGLAAGLDQPSAGAVVVGGRELTGPSPDAALIFQDHNLFPWMTVADNVAYGLRARGLGKAAARKRALELLAKVGLANVAKTAPSALSGGMRQRVALVRAFAVEPKLLLMDEPFGALDHQTRRLMQAFLLQTWAESGATVILVTHDLEEALLLADRLVLITGAPGRIEEVLDIDLPRPRDKRDPALLALAERLEAHLAAAAAAAEFTDAELSLFAALRSTEAAPRRAPPEKIEQREQAQMIQVTFVQPDGAEHMVEAAPGVSAMAAAVDGGAPGILGDCGGSCSCATCHVFVPEEWRAAVGPASPEEEGLLEGREDAGPGSRLACQIRLTEKLNGLRLLTPEEQY